jgi:hypothetical protein
MPKNDVISRAKRDAKQGKAPSTQAGEFVREEIEHIRHGVHGARSAKQAIAIGLSKARRAGVKLPPPRKGRTSAEIRRKAERDLARGLSRHPRRTSHARSRAVLKALRRESTASASHRPLSRQTTARAQRRGAAARHQAAERAVRTKGRAQLRRAARKAAKTRLAH